MPTEPLREIQRRSGAVVNDDGTILRYAPSGGPGAHDEYGALRGAWAVAELDQRCLLSVGGRDRRALLQSVVSQDVGTLAPERGCRAALLEPRGQIIATLRILECEEESLIEVVTSRAALVRGRLEHYRVAAKVTFSPRDDLVLAIAGPSAAQELAGIGLVRLPSENDEHKAAAVDGMRVRVVRAGDLPGGGYVIYCARQDGPALWQALAQHGARPVGREALDAARVEEGIPWQETDIVQGTLLHEAGLVAALHSPRKGCYVGQEVVARLESRGANVSRRLCRLGLTAMVPPGTPLRQGPQAAGTLTTSALSPRLGPCALGYVHRNYLEPGSLLEAGEARATVLGVANEQLAASGQPTL